MKNYLKDKLNSGACVVGMWSIINSPTLSDIGALAGLDFQILDIEHGVYSLEGLENRIRACEKSHCSPLVRVSDLNASQIQMSLDLGAHGIIVPQIKNLDDALQVVKFSKFHPSGSRGFNPFTRGGKYNPTLPLADTMLRNDFGLVSIIIENKNSYLMLDEILLIQELDLIYLGVYDMSCALGLQGNINHPQIQDFLESAIEKIKKAGKFIGLMVKNKDEIKEYTKKGVQFIVYGVDSNHFYQSVESKVKEFNEYKSR